MPNAECRLSMSLCHSNNADADANANGESESESESESEGAMPRRQTSPRDARAFLVSKFPTVTAASTVAGKFGDKKGAAFRLFRKAKPKKKKTTKTSQVTHDDEGAQQPSARPGTRQSRGPKVAKKKLKMGEKASQSGGFANPNPQFSSFKPPDWSTSTDAIPQTRSFAATFSYNSYVEHVRERERGPSTFAQSFACVLC